MYSEIDEITVALHSSGVEPTIHLVAVFRKVPWITWDSHSLTSWQIESEDDDEKTWRIIDRFESHQISDTVIFPRGVKRCAG